MTSNRKALADSIGERLKQLREARHLTQISLCHLTGLQNSYVSGLEHGIRLPTLQTMGKLALALDISLADFFKPLADAGLNLDPITASMPDEMFCKAMALYIPRLDAADLEVLLMLADKLAEPKVSRQEKLAKGAGIF
jgi:transcriptional regulator with XRE-family HTH domain